MSEEKVYLVNFGSDLSEEIIKEIEKECKLDVEEIRIKASLNLKKHSSQIQVHDLIVENRKYFENKYIINLPGLPIFSAILIVELNALTGQFPLILECIKQYDSGQVFSKYTFKRLYNLERERQQSRENFKQTK